MKATVEVLTQNDYRIARSRVVAGSFYVSLVQAETTSGDSGGPVFRRRRRDGKIVAFALISAKDRNNGKISLITNFESHWTWIKDNTDVDPVPQ